MSDNDDSVQARLSVRSNFAGIHLRASAEAARIACEIEQKNTAKPLGPWFDGMMTAVPVSVVMAGAALEASVNELAQDIIEGMTTLTFSEGCKILLQDLTKDRGGNAIDRYRRLALLFDKVPNTETATWQDALNLVRFRNSFMHFKPAWDYQEDVHNSKLVKYLRGRVRVAPFYAANFQFPYGFMTYDCAKWCVDTVLAFSADFSALLDVKDRLKQWHSDLRLP